MDISAYTNINNIASAGFPDFISQKLACLDAETRKKKLICHDANKIVYRKIN